MQGPEVWPRDSASYRRVVSGLSFLVIFQCGSLVVKALRDGAIRGAVSFPASHHQSAGSLNYHRSTRWNRTTHATLAQGSIAVICGVSTLIAAFLSTLDEKPVNVILSCLAAASRWVDASYAWERFLLVHPDFTPTRWQMLKVRLFIFVGLSLPYLMPPGYWIIAYYGDGLKHRHYWVYRSIIGCMALLDLFMVPATVYWDCSLGCRFINKIRQLNASLQRSGGGGGGGGGGDGRTDGRDAPSLSYTQVLLSLACNTLAYILISFLANAALVLAYCKIIPGVALVSLLFHLSFSWTTFYLLGAKASTVTFAFLSNFLFFLRHGECSRRRCQGRTTEDALGPSEKVSPFDTTTSGVTPTAEMRAAGSAGGRFRVSTPTATLPPSRGAMPVPLAGTEGSLGLPTVPEDEASERPFHSIALTSPPLATAKSPSPSPHARASPQSLSPSWGLQSHHSPSPPKNANGNSSTSARPPLRSFAHYVLGRGADTRGLFRLSEEGSSQATGGASSSDSGSGGGGDDDDDDDMSSRLTGTTPSSGGSGKDNNSSRRRRRVGLWRGGARNASSTASASTAPGRRTMLGIESAFSLSPPLSSSASSSTKSGSGSAARSPASV